MFITCIGYVIADVSDNGHHVNVSVHYNEGLLYNINYKNVPFCEACHWGQ
jgi:hypothetical protein